MKKLYIKSIYILINNLNVYIKYIYIWINNFKKKIIYKIHLYLN